MMKLDFLSETGDKIATIESAREHGVVLSGRGAGEAGMAVYQCRMALKAKLSRDPTSDEIVEGLLAGEEWSSQVRESK